MIFNTLSYWWHDFVFSQIIYNKIITMKTLITPGVNSLLAKLFMSVCSLLLTVATFAQETKKVDVDINTNSGGGSFFASPWVWVVGVAVFILLLVALMRGGNRRDV